MRFVSYKNDYIFSSRFIISAQPQCRMVVTGWKGMTSARTFLPKHDRAHYLRLCGHEFSGGKLAAYMSLKRKMYVKHVSSDIRTFCDKNKYYYIVYSS